MWKVKHSASLSFSLDGSRGRRGCSEIASCILAWVDMIHVKAGCKLVCWSDSCASQNKTAATTSVAGIKRQHQTGPADSNFISVKKAKPKAPSNASQSK